MKSRSPRDVAIDFEAVKVAMRQSKEGIVLNLSLHPNDVPPELWIHPIGARYRVALVQVGDDEEPVPKPKTKEQSIVAEAGALCRDKKFQSWMCQAHRSHWPWDLDEDLEEMTAIALRDFCMIGSRKELADNPAAKRIFDQLRIEYMKHINAQ